MHIPDSPPSPTPQSGSLPHPDHAAVSAQFNISAWAIRNPIPTILLFIFITLAGLLAFRSMKIQDFPDVDLPLVSVTTIVPGATPAQLENDVARKLENAFATLQGVQRQFSTITDGVVTQAIRFHLEKNVQIAQEEVRSAVSKVRMDLPSAAREPVISKFDLTNSPMLAYTISSSRLDEEALSWYVDNTITKQLFAVRGVGAVQRVGGVNREVRVELDPLKIQSLRTTVADVSRRLSQVPIERAGGKTEAGGLEQPLRTLATVASAQDLAAVPIALSDGRRIRLGDVARIVDGYSKPSAAAFLNGKSVVGFEVMGARGADVVKVGTGVRAALAQLGKEHADLQLTESFDFVTPVTDNYQSSLSLLYEGALLAVLVVWLFLRDLRATLIAAVALPLAVIPAFWGMQHLGFSLNRVTLLALSLVVGLLVDDAIVEVENIVRHMRMGKSPLQAAIDASAEIGLAVMATTGTLIAVFLPTAFMSGVVGKFFVQFGWTASLAVFASLIVARLLTPMMAAFMLHPLLREKPNPSAGTSAWGRLKQWLHSHPAEPSWLRHYVRWADWCLRHRWLTLLGALAFFVFSLMLINWLPKGFIPPDNHSQTQIHLELAPGSTLEQTSASAEAARNLVMQLPAIKSVYTTIGGGTAGSGFSLPSVAEARKATLTIQLQDRTQRPRKQVIENQLRAKLATLPGVRSKVGLGGSEQYLLTLSSSDVHSLNQAAAAVERDLRNVRGLGNIESSAALVRSEVRVLPDLERAADMGVTSGDIAETLRVATVGDYDNMVGKLNFSQRQVPIIVRLADSGLRDLQTLEQLSVPGSRGPVPLGQVAKLQYSGGPTQISRMNRERNIIFTIELADLSLGEMQATVKTLRSLKALPPNVSQLAIGDAENMADLFADFSLAMLIGIFLIYGVLVLLFGSFLHPVTILGALPLSFGGAFLSLLLTGKLLAMPSLLGLVMLLGIATKNSILLVDYATLAREAGLNRYDALLDACRKRARPIIMTSVAMGAGMLPIALEWGATDGSFGAPMAVAVIGGLVTSTVLSLLVIPPLYVIIDDWGVGLKRRMRKWTGSGQKPQLLPPKAQAEA